MARLFGVDYPPSVAFAFGIFILIILLLNQTIYLSTFARLNKELAQNYALLQYRLEKLEGIVKQYHAGDFQNAQLESGSGEDKPIDSGEAATQDISGSLPGDINLSLTQT